MLTHLGSACLKLLDGIEQLGGYATLDWLRVLFVVAQSPLLGHATMGFSLVLKLVSVFNHAVPLDLREVRSTGASQHPEPRAPPHHDVLAAHPWAAPCLAWRDWPSVHSLAYLVLQVLAEWLVGLPAEVLGGRVVRPIQACLSKMAESPSSFGVGRTDALACARALALVYRANQQVRLHQGGRCCWFNH